MNFIENESRTKLRGGYYTNPEIAKFLARWVFALNPQSLLEPSCGDGVFIDAINQLNTGCLQSLVACEIDPSEANKAKRRTRALHTAVNSSVLTVDFLEWSLSKIDRPFAVDGVLGNPPFVRYQYLGDAQQSRMQNVFKLFNLPFTKHTNVWVPFVLLSIADLRPGGRLAMVVPSEILHVLYAQSLRTFLASECSRILIIDPEELWFSDTLQGVVLLLAEKKTNETDKGHGVAIKQVRSRAFLNDDPAAYFANAEYSNGEVIKGKWMPALLTSKERNLLKKLSRRPGVVRFGDVADVDVGIVTGANKFFLVPNEVVDQYGLHQWARPMFGRSAHVRGVIYDEKSHDENRRAGLPANFLWFKEAELRDLPDRVRQYILKGEAEQLHRRYKCRIRTPWYGVPYVSTAPVAMLKRAHDYPRLILNRAEAYTTDTAYRVRPSRVESGQLVYSFVNSLTALTAELEGRHYGGGVLELVPSEIERLLIPITPPEPALLERLNQAIRRDGPPEKVLHMQDDVLLGQVGLGQQERELLFCAWDRLRSRRQRRQKDRSRPAANQ
jgi:adenine-specific DNA-methyltransferase